ncbi:Homeobox-leucine zipper protein [Musa troglodytarum]|nr:Homeobox-leucine zipper protein [Musa troglodytarum]
MLKTRWTSRHCSHLLQNKERKMKCSKLGIDSNWHVLLVNLARLQDAFVPTQSKQARLKGNLTSRVQDKASVLDTDPMISKLGEEYSAVCGSSSAKSLHGQESCHNTALVIILWLKGNRLS